MKAPLERTVTAALETSYAIAERGDEGLWWYIGHFRSEADARKQLCALKTDKRIGRSKEWGIVKTETITTTIKTPMTQ